MVITISGSQAEFLDLPPGTLTEVIYASLNSNMRSKNDSDGVNNRLLKVTDYYQQINTASALQTMTWNISYLYLLPSPVGFHLDRPMPNCYVSKLLVFHAASIRLTSDLSKI